MTIETILIIVGVVLLFLTYRKLATLAESFDVKNANEEDSGKEQDQKNINFQNWLYEKLKTIEEKVGELSDVSTAENPAWGGNSASSLKNENLIKLYSEHLVGKEKLSQKDALCKARFVVNNFEGGVIDDISRDIRFHAEVKSEEELISSDFFKKQVEEKAHVLKPKEIFEPLWIGIKNRKWKKEDELLQNTRKAFESHSGQYGYQNYIEDSAIIYKLEHLGIFGLRKEKTEYSFQESQDRAKLGVSHDASVEEIKNAHVKLAKKYHPDNADGNMEKFTEINTAYKNLSQKSEVRKTMSGHPFYILKEDDLQKLRKIIFANDEQNSEYYSDTYLEGEHPKDERVELPFQRPFEH